MSLSRDQVRDLVIEGIKESLQEKDQVKIDDNTDPIRELGLDSHDGVDFACAISEKLQCNIPDLVNPFLNDTGRRPRRVGEIVDLVWKLAEQDKVNNND